MAEFKAIAPGVEVNGETVLSVVNAMKGFEDLALDILKNNGIDNPKPGHWYLQQSWLNAFKEIAEKLGVSTLLNIGKAIPENAQFPPEIDSLQKGLSLIDMAYHMNHRGGDIGYYKLIDYSDEKKQAIMECNNPYPSHFDKGIIICFARKFKPVGAISISVDLDETKPTRTNGADSCTYIIKW